MSYLHRAIARPEQFWQKKIVKVNVIGHVLLEIFRRAMESKSHQLFQRYQIFTFENQLKYSY